MASFNEALVVNGSVSATSLNVPDKSIGADKVVHHFALQYFQAAGADIVTATIPLHTMLRDGELVAVEVVATTAPAGGDKKFTVDLHKGSQAAAFATMLSAVVTYDNTKANRQVVAAALASTLLADGDTLQVIVTTSGATGTQGQGLVVTVTIRENPKA